MGSNHRGILGLLIESQCSPSVVFARNFMAQRRLFSPDIVGSDAFLEMPISSQALYFHLGMYADDDGFVNPKKIMRMIGVGEDDLKVLVGKRFVLPFETGVVVIKHWLIHNTIRMDRYKPTRYVEEKARLQIKENKAYTELATIRQPSGNQLAPEVKLSQVKIRESSAVSIAPPWVLEEKLQKMETVENTYLDIIATFIREKPVQVDNARQLSAIIARYCRIAKQLAGTYTNKQIFDAVKRIKADNVERKRKGNEQIDYTLETVYKILTK